MRLELTGRHLTITPATRRVVERRLAPVLRLLNDSAVSAQVVLTHEKLRTHAEVTLHARGEHFLHAEGAGRDVAVALGAAVDKIARQAQKLKGKWDGRRRGRAPAPAPRGTRPAPELEPAASARVLRVEGGPRIIRSRRYAVKPMSIEDAAAEIGNGNDGVLVFRNSTTDAITVMFRRTDGNIGLIEPEA